jgi:hypothetical protein
VATRPVNILLDFQYLTSEPWVGGDEWAPQGFEFSPPEMFASCSIKIVPVRMRRELDVHMQYENEKRVRTIAESVAERLLREVTTIVTHCERYVAAERFWLNEFDGAMPQPALSWDRSNNIEKDNQWDSVNYVIDSSSLERLQMDCGADSYVIIMAAHAIVLSSLNGLEDLALAMAQGNGLKTTVVPTRLRPRGNLSFKEFVHSVKKTIGKVLEHEPYASEILTRAGKLYQGEDSVPLIDTGVQISTSVPELDSISVKQTLANNPALARGVKTLLGIQQIASETTIECAYRSAYIDRKSLEIFLDYLSKVLEEAKRNVEVRLEAIDLNHLSESVSRSIIQDTSDAFNFN